ncbi:unnamed protein product, partial [Vitis vinifera]
MLLCMPIKFLLSLLIRLERWQSCLLQHYSQQHWCCKGIKRTCIHGFKTNLLGCHEPHSVDALQPNL